MTQNFENTVTLTEKGVRIGGKYEALLCGSLFYFRLPRAVWKERIARLKAVGYNCVDVYFPWNYHENEDGSFDFSGERDVRAFLSELKAAGLYVIARPGPYICSEWNGGGLPARILESGMPIRCADERFLAEAERWYAAILREIAPFTYGNGGSVILLQLENELDFFDCPDPAAYISRLYEAAHAVIADIPCFCCAGQYDIARAGGTVRAEVGATLNCYPDSLDPTFDAELQGYALRFLKEGKPLLVSETNRDHFLLRRELSCGAKLLGAYNQVAGNNFDHHQAINNWGTPDAFIMTVYDFESMIDAAGNYRPEAEEAVLFSAFLRVAGQAIAAATPAAEPILPERCSFSTAKGGLRVLALDGGGYAVCVPDFSGDGEIEFSCGGLSVTAAVRKQTAPFFLFGLDLAAHGIPAKLTRANCEPIFADAKNLVFYAEGAPCIGLDFGGGEQLVRADTEIGGVSVRFLDRAGALGLLTGKTSLSEQQYVFEKFGGFFPSALPPRRAADGARQGTHFGALGVREGLAEYTVQIPEGRSLFIERPCDMLRVTAEGVGAETRHADGRDVLVPPAKGGKYVVEIEKWGHCNFDDPQSPALRIASKKGAVSFGAACVETVERCDFRLLDDFGGERVELTDGMPVRIGVSKWNSTRKPVICSYTTTAERKADRLILKTTEAADVAVYLDGKRVGLCDFGTFELTEMFKRGQKRALTVVYRKHVWTQDVGELKLLHIDNVTPAGVRVRTGKELAAMKKCGGTVALPQDVSSELAFGVTLAVPREGYLKFTGKNVKLTCVAGGRVVGRLLLGWTHAPSLLSGDADLLYVCPAWNGPVFFLAEALGEGARLEKAEFLSVPTARTEA